MVSSIRGEYAKICDVSGERATSGGVSNGWSVLAHIYLERKILHTWSAKTVSSKFPEIRNRYGNKINIHIMGEENYTIIESLSSDVKISNIMDEFDLRSYRRHLQIADENNRMRYAISA